MGTLVGKGKTQLLCETYINIKPPMSQVLRETYSVTIAETTVFADQVVVKGNVEKTLYYLHPHGKKASNDGQEEANKDEANKDEANKDEANKDEKAQDDKDDDKKDQAKEEEKQSDAFKCLNSWGQLLDSYGGIVHFNQQIFEFMGTVAIAGVVPGDTVTVEQAAVNEYESFAATTVENNGLTSGGTQVFKIDIAVTATK